MFNKLIIKISYIRILQSTFRSIQSIGSFYIFLINLIETDIIALHRKKKQLHQLINNKYISF